MSTKLNQELSAVNLKDALGKAECYTQNIGELIGEIEDEIVLDGEGKVIMDWSAVVKLLQTLWDKVKETALECEGKTIEVKLPGGIAGQILSIALAAIGFRL